MNLPELMPMTLPFTTIATLQPKSRHAIANNNRIFDFIGFPPNNQ
jgi:hypothetical protein